MKSKTNKRYYYCRYCSQRFDSFYMADTCYQLDLKILQNDKPDKQIPERSKQPRN